MTGLLAERARRVLAVEIDASLAEGLRKKFQGERRIEILNADILTLDLATLCRRLEAEKCFVFGNLPYYITSPILNHLAKFRDSIRALTLLAQREVAERLVAEPGARAYGYLTISTQLFSQPRVRFGVPPGAFSPAPKVNSALVSFEMVSRFPEWGRNEALEFLEFAKRCFAQKRKSLLNNLAGVHSRRRLEQELTSAGLPLNLRAEQMTIEQMAALFPRLRAKAQE